MLRSWLATGCKVPITCEKYSAVDQVCVLISNMLNGKLVILIYVIWMFKHKKAEAISDTYRHSSAVRSVKLLDITPCKLLLERSLHNKILRNPTEGRGNIQKAASNI